MKQFVINDLPQEAVIFAMTAHNGQQRKYNGNPYVLHPISVALRLVEYLEGKAGTDMIIAALLHDVLEDTKVPAAAIEKSFGREVVRLVGELTNVSKGLKGKDGRSLSRAERKQIDHARLLTVSHPAKIIKMLDRIDNLAELLGSPKDFRELYANESLSLLKSVGDADPKLAEALLAAIKKVQDTV